MKLILFPPSFVYFTAMPIDYMLFTCIFRWLSKDGIGAVGRLLIGGEMMNESKGNRLL